MLHYAYDIQPGDAKSPSENHRHLFGQTAILHPAQELLAGQPWPDLGLAILAQEVPMDSRSELDAQMHAWMDSAPAGPKLEVVFRSIRVVWKSGRT